MGDYWADPGGWGVTTPSAYAAAPAAAPSAAASGNGGAPAATIEIAEQPEAEYEAAQWEAEQVAVQAAAKGAEQPEAVYEAEQWEAEQAAAPERTSTIGAPPLPPLGGAPGVPTLTEFEEQVEGIRQEIKETAPPLYSKEWGPLGIVPSAGKYAPIILEKQMREAAGLYPYGPQPLITTGEEAKRAEAEARRLMMYPKDKPRELRDLFVDPHRISSYRGVGEGQRIQTSIGEFYVGAGGGIWGGEGMGEITPVTVEIRGRPVILSQQEIKTLQFLPTKGGYYDIGRIAADERYWGTFEKVQPGFSEIAPYITEEGNIRPEVVLALPFTMLATFGITKAWYTETKRGLKRIEEQKVALGELAPYVEKDIWAGFGGYPSGYVGPGYNLVQARDAGILPATILAAGFTKEQLEKAQAIVVPSPLEEFEPREGLYIGPYEEAARERLLGGARMYPGLGYGSEGLFGPANIPKEEYAARFVGFGEGIPQLGKTVWMGEPEPKIIQWMKGGPIVGPLSQAIFQREYLAPLQKVFLYGEALAGAALIGVPVIKAVRMGRPALKLMGTAFERFDLGAISRAEMQAIAKRAAMPEGPALRPVFTGTELYYPYKPGTFPKVPGLYGPTLGEEWALTGGIEPGRVVTPRQLGFTAKTRPYIVRPYVVGEGPVPETFRLGGVELYKAPGAEGLWGRGFTRPPFIPGLPSGPAGPGIATQKFMAGFRTSPEVYATQYQKMVESWGVPKPWEVKGMLAIVEAPGLAPGKVEMPGLAPVMPWVGPGVGFPVAVPPSILPVVFPPVVPVIPGVEVPERKPVVTPGLAPVLVPGFSPLVAPSPFAISFPRFEPLFKPSPFLYGYPSPITYPAPEPLIYPSPEPFPFPTLAPPATFIPPIDIPPIPLPTTPPSEIPPPDIIPPIWPGLPKMGRGLARRRRVLGGLYGKREWIFPELIISFPEPFTLERREVRLAKKRKVPYGAKRIRSRIVPGTRMLKGIRIG